MQINGNQLTPKIKKKVLAIFLNRYTGDHKPTWVTNEPVQFKDDNEWLANTTFDITQKGDISIRSRYCTSNPTWPNNPELST